MYPGRRKKQRTLHPRDQASTHPAYQRLISMYQTPPTEDIELEEFQRFALARLQCNFRNRIP